MVKAIFHADFNYTSRKTNAGWSIKASKTPQVFPRECIEAAIKAGVTSKAPVKALKKNSEQP